MLSLAGDPVTPSSNAASQYLPLTAAKKTSLLLRTSLIPLRPPVHLGKSHQLKVLKPICEVNCALGYNIVTGPLDDNIDLLGGPFHLPQGSATGSNQYGDFLSLTGRLVAQGCRCSDCSGPLPCPCCYWLHCGMSCRGGVVPVTGCTLHYSQFVPG